MKSKSLNPTPWEFPRLWAPSAGAQVCLLKFRLDSVPIQAKICSQGYPFHALYLNDEFVGSDEFAFVTEYDIKSKLRKGENELKALLVSEGRNRWSSNGVKDHSVDEETSWFSVSSSGLRIDLSTRNPDWHWVADDPLTDSGIAICLRGTPEEPWDGNGAQYREVPLRTCYPTGVMAVSWRDAGELFPKGDAVIPYRAGEQEPFEGEVIFDFGVETLGYLELEIESQVDCDITLACDESMIGFIHEYTWQGWNRFRVKKGSNRIVDPSRKGFRYARISTEHGGRLVVKSILNHQPVREFRNRGFFKCSDEFLNRVNEVSCHTVELCAQKFLEDGIKRDRLCWTGDLRPEALVMYTQLGETDIVRSSLYDFARHTNEHGVIQPSFPWKTGWVMADYVMWWIISLYEYYQYTGDIKTLRELEPVAREQEKWLKERVDERGLLIARAEYDAPITCWSSRKREGYTAYHNLLWHHTRHCLMERVQFSGSNVVFRCCECQ